MNCEECGGKMQPLGYGDERCEDCGHSEYSESEEDFEERMSRTTAHIITRE